MERHNGFPFRGLFHREIIFVRDYRRRGYWIGVFQLVVSLCYFVAALLFNRLMLNISSSINREYLNENQAPHSSVKNVQASFDDSLFPEVHFWITLNIIRASLHIVTSVLLIWATTESIAIIRAINICYWTKCLNLAFLLYENLVLMILYKKWQLALLFILYRYCFNREVCGLLNQLEILSPPPPGHVHHE